MTASKFTIKQILEGLVILFSLVTHCCQSSLKRSAFFKNAKDSPAPTHSPILLAANASGVIGCDCLLIVNQFPTACKATCCQSAYREVAEISHAVTVLDMIGWGRAQDSRWGWEENRSGLGRGKVLQN